MEEIFHCHSILDFGYVSRSQIELHLGTEFDDPAQSVVWFSEVTDQPAPVVHHHSLEPILFWVGEQHYLLENSAVDLDSLEFDGVENVAFAISFKQFFEVVQLELVVLDIDEW